MVSYFIYAADDFDNLGNRSIIIFHSDARGTIMKKEQKVHLHHKIFSGYFLPVISDFELLSRRKRVRNILFY